ncbi:DoxX family protein [Methylobacterium sp. sgz302541]|uniref:DoxX family protein n=1 Tax=unclassified Methylobacterium TaxID=2615210 RepID=UPI003D33872C
MTGRAQDATLLLARLLLAAALLPTGIARALNVSGFALTLAGASVPAPNAVATLAVVVQVFGPLALMLGVLPRVTGLALAGFAALTAPVLHPFWLFSGAAMVAERALFLADLGLAGGLLVYALTGPGAWSWHGVRLGSLLPAPKKGAGRQPARKRSSSGRAPARAAA